MRNFAFFSAAVLGTQFPGAGTVYLKQDLHFIRAVRIGDTLTVIVTVKAKNDEQQQVELDCEVINQKGELVLQGDASVIAPTQKIRQPKIYAPHIQLSDPEARFKTLLAMAAQGDVEILMKGSLHTDELLHAVLSQPNLRTGRRMSHVFRFVVPLYAKPLFVTDAALNIFPTLLENVDIIQNAIDLAQMMGIAMPKLALLSALETVNPAIPSTIDAAALCKMADRGQIQGGILDGPLAFDNAISAHAAQIKHINSPVAGDADILVVPDLESGNMLAKQLEYLAGASGSGIVMGARRCISHTILPAYARSCVRFPVCRKWPALTQRFMQARLLCIRRLRCLPRSRT